MFHSVSKCFLTFHVIMLPNSCSVANCSYLIRPSHINSLPFVVIFCFSFLLIKRPQGFPGLIWHVIPYDLLLSFTPLATPRILSFSLGCMCKAQSEGESKVSAGRQDRHHLAVITSLKRSRDITLCCECLFVVFVLKMKSMFVLYSDNK